MFIFVCPCYNEEQRWGGAAYWRPILGLPGTRWIFVDDGSTDSTANLLEESASWGDVQVLRTASNRGKAEAVRFGLLQALGDERNRDDVIGVGFMDSDGAFTLQDLTHLMDVHTQVVRNVEVDATWSSRVALFGRKIERTPARHYLGRAVSTLISLGAEQTPYDTQSGLKIFAPSAVLKSCLDSSFSTRWLFELELMIRWSEVASRPMQIWEEPLNAWSEVAGSKVSSREYCRILKELMIIKQMQVAQKRLVRGAMVQKER